MMIKPTRLLCMIAVRFHGTVGFAQAEDWSVAVTPYFWASGVSGTSVVSPITVVGGYRYLGVDRRGGDFLYDVEQQGLLLRTGISF